jgi:hypothetical protein
MEIIPILETIKLHVETFQETFPVRINAMSQRRQLVFHQFKIGATSASNAGLDNRVFS